MKLVHIETGKPVKRGETVRDFRGDLATVVGWDKPKHAGSTGRVYVKAGPVAAEWSQGFYPSVFDLEWIEREDRA